MLRIVYGALWIVLLSGVCQSLADTDAQDTQAHLSTSESVQTESASNESSSILDNEHMSTIFVSTLDGQLHALEAATGTQHWILHDEPVIRVPVTVQRGFTFMPDPKDGSLYALADGRLKKLPFTIPQLVQASPCKTSDGVLYAGNKRDSWLAVEQTTGRRVTLSHDSTQPNEHYCPASNQRTLFIGRTQYRISMFDGTSLHKRWNATFTDYSSSVLPEDTSYSFLHMTSCADGLLLTADAETGHILWDKQFAAPVVAIYIMQNNGLHRLPFSVFGKETLQALTDQSSEGVYSPKAVRDLVLSLRDSNQQSTAEQQSTTALERLYRTLYVGESVNGLYALPSLVDETTVTIVPDARPLPLIDGPQAISQPAPQPRPHIYMANADVKHQDMLLLGHHEKPVPTELRLESSGAGQYLYSHLPSIDYVPQAPLPAPVPPPDTNLPVPVPPASALPPLLYTLLTVCVTALGILCYHCFSTSRFGHQALALSQTSSHNGSSPGTTGRGSFIPTNQSQTVGPVLVDGHVAIGSLMFDPRHILGRGCEGTVVFRGKFDGRQVAIKRVVAEFLNLADREVELLRETDMHPNVVRYFCMEADSQFRYIALELCWASLHDYVQDCDIRHKVLLTEHELLHQASVGLKHLHSLNIVHRDVKPHNVLLSEPRSDGQCRVLISDFGLCKKLAFGKNSLSRRSGNMAGTDGWMAPEALFSDRSVTTASDVFSLGCIFYYVLSHGQHPFGDSIRRQANIVHSDCTFEHLQQDSQVLAVNVIGCMLSKAANQRPSCAAVLCHPLFWTRSQQLAFLQDVSDRVEKDDVISECMVRLEKGARSVVRDDWKQHICEHLHIDLRQFRTYRGQSIRDLLRAMRNKKHHYRELPAELRQSLGDIPDQFVEYFTGRFPRLLLHTYHALDCVKQEHNAQLAKYYASDYDFGCACSSTTVAAKDPVPDSPDPDPEIEQPPIESNNVELNTARQLQKKQNNTAKKRRAKGKHKANNENKEQMCLMQDSIVLTREESPSLAK